LESIKTAFSLELDTQLKELVAQFPDVTKETQGLPPHRGIFDHKIRLTAYPKRQRRNRLFVPEYEELKRQCIDLFQQGLVRVPNSPYAAPIVMVRKPHGSIQVCFDYIALNECTAKDSFPLPRINDLLDKLRNAECMTHLDFRLVYNQVRMSDDGPQDDFIPVIAFQGLTPNEAYYLMEMLVMGFGLCNAPTTFPRLMNHVLEPYINKLVIVYLHDICFYSETPEQHIEQLQLVL
jgi:hypothetical protein